MGFPLFPHHFPLESIAQSHRCSHLPLLIFISPNSTPFCILKGQRICHIKDLVYSQHNTPNPYDIPVQTQPDTYQRESLKIILGRCQDRFWMEVFRSPKFACTSCSWINALDTWSYLTAYCVKLTAAHVHAPVLELIFIRYTVICPYILHLNL